MDETRWLSEREARAWRSLQLMHLQLDARMAHDLAEVSDLSYPDYVVLTVLTDQPDNRMRAFALARELGWEQSRLSHHLGRMATRGLVTKQRCPSDRRGFDVTATDLALQRMAAASPSHVATVRRHFIDQLTADQLDAVAEVATTVLDALAATCTEGEASA
jgi:DNA-binding MarR family transcriptional regulator